MGVRPAAKDVGNDTFSPSVLAMLLLSVPRVRVELTLRGLSTRRVGEAEAMVRIRGDRSIGFKRW